MKPNQPILLVEDDRVDAMTVTRALKQLSVTNPINHVTDGEKGLAFLRDAKNPRPGLILLDLNMPRMNGLEMLRILKDDPDLRAIPVVILTTSKADADRVDSFQLSVAGYMVKPVDFDQTLELMRTIKDYWTTSEPSAN
jgi:CheY-like chemotaxis protein